jgi:hypothetical protein
VWTLTIHALYENLVTHKIGRATTITTKCKIKPAHFLFINHIVVNSLVEAYYDQIICYGVKCSPMIDEPRHISIFSSINHILDLFLNQSTHIINTSIDVIEITAIRCVISDVDINQVSKYMYTDNLKEITPWRNVNLSRLLRASCTSKTSPMYSQTNVPRRIVSPALTAHPYKSPHKGQYHKPR